jgi:hypothetical protein
MQVRSFRILPPLLSSIVFICRAILSTPALAEGEQWVSHYHGADIGAPDQVHGLLAHQSDEVTAVGLSCNDLMVLRIDRDGNELWSRIDVEDYYYVQGGVSAVSSGEGVIVSIPYFYPYGESFTEIYHYDRLGNEVWESGASTLSAMVADGSGGVILAGWASNDLCPCPGFVARLGNDGNYRWADRPEPKAFPEEVQFGNMTVLAVDSTHVYAAGTVSGETITWSVIVKYALDGGEKQWEERVLPEEQSAGISWIAPASDGSIAVAGHATSGTWLGRYSSEGALLWRRPLVTSGLASNPSNGIVYIVNWIAGDTGGSDITLTAVDLDGNVIWESRYDSGAGSEDIPGAMNLDHDGSIVLLSRSDGSVLLLRYEASGALVSSDVLGVTPPAGTALVLDVPHDRVLAFRSFADRPCCDSTTDVWIASYDKRGDGPRILTEFDRLITPILSRGIGVQVGLDGKVVAQIATSYRCATSLDLVGYGPEGNHLWTRVHPEGAVSCFDGSGQATVGCKNGDTISLVRYDTSGMVIRKRSIPSVPDARLDGMAPAPNGGALLIDVMSQGTTLIQVDAEGSEQWRRTLEGVRVVDGVVDPHGRTYLQSWTQSLLPQIDCLNESGEPEWTRILDGPERLFPNDMTAVEGGLAYLTGHISRQDGYRWVTYQFAPDGQTSWVVHEYGTVGPHFLNEPVRIHPHPTGGIVVAGTLENATSSDAITVRYDEDGSLLWRSGLDTEPRERCFDMTVDGAGNVLVAMEEATGHVRTTKYDAAGIPIWSRGFASGGGPNNLLAIGVGPDLRVAVVGAAHGDSAFTLQYADANPVTVSNFAAQRRDGDVLVSWEVASGLEPVGFDVFHGPAQDRVDFRLNPKPIPAESRSYVHRGVAGGAHYYLLAALGEDGSIQRYGPVLAGASESPARFWMTGPRPNPTRGGAAWEVGLPRPGRVQLVVHDAAGRTVAQVLDATLPVGAHHLFWDARLGNGAPASAGVYFYRLLAPGEERTGKLVLQPPR